MHWAILYSLVLLQRDMKTDSHRIELHYYFLLIHYQIEELYYYNRFLRQFELHFQQFHSLIIILFTLCRLYLSFHIETTWKYLLLVLSIYYIWNNCFLFLKKIFATIRYLLISKGRLQTIQMYYYSQYSYLSHCHHKCYLFLLPLRI